MFHHTRSLSYYLRVGNNVQEIFKGPIFLVNDDLEKETMLQQQKQVEDSITKKVLFTRHSLLLQLLVVKHHSLNHASNF